MEKIETIAATTIKCPFCMTVDKQIKDPRIGNAYLIFCFNCRHVYSADVTGGVVATKGEAEKYVSLHVENAPMGVDENGYLQVGPRARTLEPLDKFLNGATDETD